MSIRIRAISEFPNEGDEISRKISEFPNEGDEISSKVVQYCAILCNVVQCCAILCNIVQYCAILCNIVQYCAILRNIVQSCAILCNVVQYCATLCNIVQCCAILCHIVQFGSNFDDIISPERASGAPEIESKSVHGPPRDAPWRPRASQGRLGSILGARQRVPGAPRERPEVP